MQGKAPDACNPWCNGRVDIGLNISNRTRHVQINSFSVGYLRHLPAVAVVGDEVKFVMRTNDHVTEKEQAK